jgi:hypothetical protein
MPLVVVVAVTVAVSHAFVLGSYRELRNIEFKYIYIYIYTRLPAAL